MSIQRSLLGFMVAMSSASWFARAAHAQAIVTTPGGSGKAVVFPDPGVGLPAPLQFPIANLPAGALPGSVAWVGPDTALVSDAGHNRVFVVRTTTAALIATIPTAGQYDGIGPMAAVPGLSAVIAMSSLGHLAVIHAPFGQSSNITAIGSFGPVTGWENIAFDPTGRAFVRNTLGTLVIEPPYTTFALNMVNSIAEGGGIAVTPDGTKLLTTDGDTELLNIYSAPFTANEFPIHRVVPSAGKLWGVAATPDGSKVLFVSAARPGLFAISPPYDASSPIERIPLPVANTDPPFSDVAISADGQLAILTSGANTDPRTLFVRAPFTAAGATVFEVSIPGGRGWGVARFLPPGVAPGLTISKSAAVSVPSGGSLTYTIAYGNTASSSLNDVVIRDEVPRGTTFESATNGGVLSGDKVRWSIGTLAPGATGQSVSLSVHVAAYTGVVKNDAYSIEAAGVPPIAGAPVLTNVVFHVTSSCECAPPAPAPCGNNGVPGNGCGNSAAHGGAELMIAGTTLRVRGTPPNATVVFVKGGQGAPVPLFDGLSCLTNTLHFGATSASAGGIATAPDQGAGSYQAWYRDRSAVPPACGSGVNLTNGITYGLGF
jgi:uncharacterized repeat protein (TIGR01451 family)